MTNETPEPQGETEVTAVLLADGHWYEVVKQDDGSGAYWSNGKEFFFTGRPEASHGSMFVSAPARYWGPASGVVALRAKLPARKTEE